MAHRVPEQQVRCMQERATRIQPWPAAVVVAVADDRMVDRPQMHPDLMGTPGLESALDQRAGNRHLESPLDAIVGDRVAPVLGDGHAGRMASRSPDRSIDRAGVSIEMALGEGKVDALGFVGAHLTDQPDVGLLAASNDQQA